MAQPLSKVSLYNLVARALYRRLYVGVPDGIPQDRINDIIGSHIKGLAADDRGFLVAFNSGGNLIAAETALRLEGYRAYWTDECGDEYPTMRVEQVAAESEVRTVHGSTGDYQVHLVGGAPVSCTCPSHAKGHRYCKHMAAFDLEVA